MELDELLEDLEAALPPENEHQQTPRQSALYKHSPSPATNGHTSPFYDPLPPAEHGPDHPHGYEMPLMSPRETSAERESRVSTMSQAVVVRYVSEQEPENDAPFDDAMYSEVRKGPRYVPKSRSQSTSPPPPPPSSSTTSPPPTKPPRIAPAGGDGLSELDNLLEMLNDTQRTIQSNQSKPLPPSEEVRVRPSVTDLVDELTAVEHHVSDKMSGASLRSPKHSATQRSNITASTATQELDDLMANLSKFEPSSTQDKGDYDHPSKSGKKSAVADLNSMLGSLNQDMASRGVNTASKGICAACKKPILAKVVNALGRQWHAEHFTCATCDMELGSTTYYESNGRPYCEKDYHELYAPRCAYCNGPILDRVMRALDKTWHPEHFFCTLCGKHFGPDGFHEKDSKAFCRECYYEKFAPRCKRCDKAIMEGYVTALSAQWHPECFCCKVCGVTFPRGNYFDHEGEPHCELHYHASRGTLCASCQKPVTGKCITAMGKKWHPEHFTCAFCLKLLNKGTFKEHRHNPYCQPCYIKLFG